MDPKINPNSEEWWQFFIYSTGFVNIGNVANIVTPTTLNIGAEADFACHAITIQVRQAGVIVVNFGGLILIEDSARGRTLMNQAVPIDTLRGSGELPYPIEPRRLFTANTTITISLTQNVAVATDVCVSFHGHKIRKS